MPQKLLMLIAALALAALPGCFSQPYPQKNYYSLQAELPKASVLHPAKPYTLVLGAVSAASGFEDRFLVYRIGPNQFETDFYNELVAAPARLLADLAAQHLDNINSKLWVVKNPGMKLADFGLEIYLEGLYGDFSQKEASAVVDIRFTLNDLRPSQARVLMDKSYHCGRVIEERKPDVLAGALNVCVNDILTEIKQDFERVIR
jgi:uncharacterized lipoprotein YmbA